MGHSALNKRCKMPEFCSLKLHVVTKTRRPLVEYITTSTTGDHWLADSSRPREIRQAHHDVQDPSWLRRATTRRNEPASFFLSHQGSSYSWILLNPSTRTEELRHSFSTRAILEWNSLPARLAQADSLDTFKRQLAGLVGDYPPPSPT